MFKKFLKKRSVDTTTMIMSKEEALAFCESYMKASKAFQACRNVPNIDASKAIASCILDITVRTILILNII